MGGMGERKDEVTRILGDGDADEEKLLPLVYDELHQIAEQRMWGERQSHTLQATALVNEAWMRLGDEKVGWRSRGHFYAAASEAMRRILVDHARRVKSQKRGGDRHRVTLGAHEASVELTIGQLTALGDALDELGREDERAAAVARLRFLSGLSVEETAAALEISERTVHREWTYARARLFDMLGTE
jgi:RNA polymerase sigma factor (TIGR02999 family)